MRKGIGSEEGRESGRHGAWARPAALAVMLALGACGPARSTSDGGPLVDAETVDAGRHDAGVGGARCTHPLGFGHMLFGTAEDDVATSVGISDDCGVYVAGTTRGKLAEGAAGGQDLFLRRIGPDDARSFVVQLGSSEDERVSAISVTAAGDALVVGDTAGVLPTVASGLGLEDAFVVRYGASGARLWLTQFGTVGNDFVLDVALVPEGHVLTAGTTDESLEYGYDVTLDELSGEDGSRRFGQRRGTGFVDRAEGIAFGPDGRLVVAGATQGSLEGAHRGSFDAFVQASEWLGASPGIGLQLGTPDIDAALDVAVDVDGTIYVALVSFADLASGAGENDGIQSAFLARIAATGELLGTTRLAPATASSRAVAVAADPRGGVLVAGSVVGAFAGSDAGGRDAMLWRVDASGIVRSAVRLGSAGNDEAHDLLVTGADEVVIVGAAGGALEGSNVHAGGLDAFVACMPLP